MTVDGGALLVQTLKKAGTEVAFVLHGGHLDPIFQACLDQDLRLIDTRHEAAAGHAADAYARQTGRVGVAIATAGPGFTNILTAITQAYLDGSPLLVIAGAAPLRDAEKWPLQGGIDQVAMAKPVTKWAAQVTRTDQIPHMTAHALRTAMSGRPGPVLLEVPIDVLFRRVDACPIPEFAEIERPSPTPAAVDRALDLLADAERPIIVVGGGALFSGAADALRTFACRTGIPVFCNNKAYGLLPADDPRCGGGLSNLAVLRASGVAAPDVALFLGARFGMFTGGDRLVPQDCRLIQVDIDAREFGRLRPVDVAILADCRETLIALDATASQCPWPGWTEWASTVHGMSRWHEAAYAELPQNDEGPVHPYHAMREIMDCLDADTIVCADGGESSQWADLVAKARHPGQFMGHGYLGCLGIGMPFAMGAQIAHPDRRVVCIVGDGAAGLNVQEFDTMVRHDLPIVTVVLNNKAWGMCVHGQQSMYGSNRLVVTTLGEGRYDQVAEGFGCFSAYVERPGDVAAAMREALASNRPACINIITDLDAVFGVTPEAEASAKAAKAGKRDEIEMPYYDNLKDE